MRRSYPNSLWRSQGVLHWSLAGQRARTVCLFQQSCASRESATVCGPFSGSIYQALRELMDGEAVPMLSSDSTSLFQLVRCGCLPSPTGDGPLNCWSPTFRGVCLLYVSVPVRLG